MVVLVFGLPGTGKSFFASRLAERLKAAYYNSDIIRKEIFQQRTYSEKEKGKVYGIMLEKMESAILHENNIVIDATFFKALLRDPFINKVHELGETIQFIEVIADVEIIKNRLKQKRDFSEADFSVYLDLKEGFEPLEIDHLTIPSTNDNIEEMLLSAMNYLKD